MPNDLLVLTDTLSSKCLNEEESRQECKYRGSHPEQVGYRGVYNLLSLEWSMRMRALGY